ncbi:MAG: hypothetical protein JO018_05230 [Candidatus Eremiobacteraeota bacterium]|nr:hypothetical protein [Candidatus Eremiobacteraeota bacterium]MBV9403117.1 hypothetical protein [Candidatus Eremiobacteraeota bacterium]MBV9972851.1 hypothetical protein [Candidatus Eremiobacteraeota bacterium]
MYDITDKRGVPVSRGVPMVVRISTVIGILAIFIIGGFTVKMASYGHDWPALRTLRLPLK